MNYTIDEKSSNPGYFQLYNLIKSQIVEGLYSYGDKLPSKRLIAEESGLSVITVAHSFELLSEEGYIKAKERSGYYVIYRKDDFSNTKEIKDFHVSPKFKETSISHNSEDISFSIVAKVMRRVILDYGEEVMVKSPNQGCLELREAICKYLARSRGIQVELDQIVIGSGAEQLYGIVAGLFFKEELIGVEAPSYEKISLVYQQRGKKIDWLKMDGVGIRTSELKRTTARLIHVTPFHSYPSGATADISKKNEYLHWARSRDGYLIEDNYDSELTVSHKPEEALFGMDDSDRVVYINTFSKTVASSMRMGYMILPRGLLGKYDKMYGSYSCTVPTFDQLVMTELLESGDFERHINRVRRARRSNGE